MWVGLSGGAAGSVSTRVCYEDGVEIVSGLSVDVCECSACTVGAWVNGSTIL